MSKRFNFILLGQLTLASGLAPNLLASRGLFSEIVLTFDREVPFSYEEKLASTSLAISLPETSINDLKILNYYDSRLISRMVTRDLGPKGSEFELFLKSRAIKATVRSLAEPNRLVVTLFAQNYQMDSDPATGLPLASLGPLTEALGEPREPMLEMASQPSFALGEAGHLPKTQASDEPEEGKHKLLQEAPKAVFASKDPVDLVQGVAEGRASYWSKYPIYMYPILVESFKGRNRPAGFAKKAAEGELTEVETLAEFGLKMFTFGHEKRALKVYQDVLAKDATLFDEDSLHLWALAELHFAHGNLTLADGYYKAFKNKFPESDLAPFSELRRADINAIHAISKGESDDLKKLASELSALKSTMAEFRAQILIHQAFWRKNDGKDQESLPYIDESMRKELQNTLPSVESKRTAFLALSLVLKSKLAKEIVWDNETAKLGAQFFATYDEKSGKPYYSPLRLEMISRIAQTLTASSIKEDYLGTVRVYEEIPNELKSVADDPEVAWSLAQALRFLGKTDESLDFYEKASKGYPKGIKRFKSQFWASVLGGLVANENRANMKKREANLAVSKSYDDLLKSQWNLLTDDEKNEFVAAYKNELEETLTAEALLRTPPMIVLYAWQKSLSSELAVSNEKDPKNWQANYSPTSQTVHLLQKLANRFTELGMIGERRQAIAILKKIKPSLLEQDKEAQKAWSKMLVDLAEEYRKDDQLLEAAELYTFAANNSVNWEDRAESLYKGGLLLYKVGKRNEAIQAFTAASQDGNNLFYANLAKERLNQLSP